MRRRRDSVHTVVEEEKRGNTISMQTHCFLGGAMPVGPLMPHEKGSMAHDLRLASWRRPTPASFDALPWERTHRGGGFSWCYFSTLLHFLKPYIVMCRAFAQQIASTSGITR